MTHEDRCREMLLVEYQMAQNSAQHHTNLGWTIISLVFAGSLIALGWVLKSFGTESAGSGLPVPSELGSVFERCGIDESRSWTAIQSSLGLVLSIAATAIDWHFARVAQRKYRRCKIIERTLGLVMTQHSAHKTTKISGVKLRLQYLVRLLFLMLAAIWVAVLISLRISG